MRPCGLKAFVAFTSATFRADGVTMTEQYILTIDPGNSTGVALGKFSATEPYTLIQGWQFGGGVVGLIDWLETHENGLWFPETGYIGDEFTIVSEKFVPVPGGGFSQSLDSTIPLVCEGALIALGVMPNYPDPTWRRANEQYFVGGSNKAEKRKRLKQFLKDTGNYRFGKDLGAPDNEDFVSAAAHGIAYVMKVLEHRPTFDTVVNWSTQTEGKS